MIVTVYEFLKLMTHQSKCFELVMLGSVYGDNMMVHRSCRILKDGVALGQAKTKKELKDLIDNGIYR